MVATGEQRAVLHPFCRTCSLPLRLDLRVRWPSRPSISAWERAYLDGSVDGPTLSRWRRATAYDADD